MFREQGKRAGKWLADQTGAAIIGIIVTGLLAFAVKHFKAMKDFGWAESLVIGFFLMLVAAIMVAHAIAIWRRSKQAPPSGYALSEGAGDAMESAAGAWEAAASANKEIALLKAQQVETLDHLNRLSAKLEDGERVSEDIRGDLTTTASQIETLINRADRTAEAFLAMRHREMLHEREKVMNDWIEKLNDVVGKTVDWDTWRQEFGYLKSHLTSWSATADQYVPGIEDQVFKVDHEILKDKNWKLEGIEFSDSEDRQDFKTFRIFSKNYINCKARVENRVCQFIWG